MPEGGWTVWRAGAVGARRRRGARWLAALAAVGALGGVSSAQALSACPADWDRELCAYVMMVEHIRHHYVDELDMPRFLEEAHRRAIGALDPHSSYLDTASRARFDELVHNRLSGIGAELALHADGLRVVEVHEASPAERAGLRAGDVVLKVDERELRGLSLAEGVGLIRGDKGTTVVLAVQRAGATMLSLSITRDIITPSRVRGRVFDDGVAWLRLPGFNAKTLEQMVQATRDWPAGGPRALVLDLRDNGGGLLQAGVGVAAAFLQPGLPVVQVVERDGRPQGRVVNVLHAQLADYRLNPGDADALAQAPAWFKSVPLAVLVNAGSASAAELAAAALRDHRRATVLGSTTFGKGVIQGQAVLPAAQGGGALSLSTARYRSPLGLPIDRRGVVPDVALPAASGPQEVLRPRQIDVPWPAHVRHPPPDEEDARQRRLAERQAAQQAQKQARAARQQVTGSMDAPAPPPVWGSEEDVWLQQARAWLLQHKMQK